MTLKELQNHLFSMLCIIDDICKKENIRYFLDSGTEIGAIREGDIIAWDDDVDIKILSEDLGQFRQAMKTHLPPYMKFVSPSDVEPGFHDFIHRVIDTRYPLKKGNEEMSYYHHLVYYAGVDVFLYSKGPDSSVSRLKTVLFCKVLYSLAMGHRYRIEYEKYTAVRKLQVKIMTFIGKRIPMNEINKWWIMYCLHPWVEKPSSTRMVCDIISFTDKLFYQDSFFQDEVRFPIRDRLFPVPVGYHEELTQYYGNYLVPVHDGNQYITHFQE